MNGQDIDADNQDSEIIKNHQHNHIDHHISDRELIVYYWNNKLGNLLTTINPNNVDNIQIRQFASIQL